MAVAQNHETILRYHNGNLTELNQIRLLQWYKTVVENETISFLTVTIPKDTTPHHSAWQCTAKGPNPV